MYILLRSRSALSAQCQIPSTQDFYHRYGISFLSRTVVYYKFNRTLSPVEVACDLYAGPCHLVARDSCYRFIHSFSSLSVHLATFRHVRAKSLSFKHTVSSWTINTLFSLLLVLSTLVAILRGESTHFERFRCHLFRKQ